MLNSLIPHNNIPHLVFSHYIFRGQPFIPLDMKEIVSYEGKKTHTGRVSKGRQVAQSDGFDDCTGARTEQRQNTFVSIKINSLKR